MIDPRRLRVFAAVAECGTFSAAAGRLAMTQSAVSQQMAALEREAGHQLVVRERSGTSLTEPGRALLRHARAVNARLLAAQEELEAIAGGRAGRLRLATFPSAGATLVPTALARFRRRRPAVQLSLREAEPERSVPALRAGELDLALCFDYPGLASLDDVEGIEATPLFEEPLLAVLPAHHPQAQEQAVDLREITGETWLAGDGSSVCHRMVVESCRRAGFEPMISYESNNDEILLSLVGAGVGVTVLPRLCLRSVPETVAVRPLAGDVPPRAVWAARRAGERPLRAALDMVEILREVAVQRGPALSSPA